MNMTINVIEFDNGYTLNISQYPKTSNYYDPYDVDDKEAERHREFRLIAKDEKEVHQLLKNYLDGKALV